MDWQIVSNIALGILVIFLTRTVSKHDKRAEEREKCKAIEIWYATKTGNLAHNTAVIVQEEKQNIRLHTAIKEYTEVDVKREEFMNKVLGKL